MAASLFGVATIGASGATRAEPPPGSQLSASLEYVARVRNEHGRRGQVRPRRGQDVLIITGRFGFKTLDVSNPTTPQVLDTFRPADILGPDGYWQDEDMDVDRRRNLIIGALDPRHDDVDQVSCPGIGTLPAKARNPGCRSGFYVIPYADPENLVQVGNFVEPSRRSHRQLCRQVQLRLGGGPGAEKTTRRTSGRSPRRGGGDGRPIWVSDLRNPTNPKVFPEPIDLLRNDGLTDYSHDVDVDAHGIAWVSGKGGSARVRDAGQVA